MQGFDLPLAFWRVHATAMQLFPDAGEEHHRLAASGIRRLADSLKEFPSLQETFLSSEPVRKIAVAGKASGVLSDTKNAVALQPPISM